MPVMLFIALTNRNDLMDVPAFVLQMSSYWRGYRMIALRRETCELRLHETRHTRTGSFCDDKSGCDDGDAAFKA